ELYAAAAFISILVATYILIQLNFNVNENARIILTKIFISTLEKFVLNDTSHFVTSRISMRDTGRSSKTLHTLLSPVYSFLGQIDEIYMGKNILDDLYLHESHVKNEVARIVESLLTLGTGVSIEHVQLSKGLSNEMKQYREWFDKPIQGIYDDLDHKKSITLDLAADIPQELRPKTTLGRAIITHQAIKFIAGQNATVNVNDFRFKKFLQLLKQCEDEDREEIKQKLIKKSEAFNFHLNVSDHILKDIAVNNYRKKDRLTMIYYQCCLLFMMSSGHPFSELLRKYARRR
ncbi:MAG: hypothetical protein WA364_17330, partial [Candidatus Nitrosopolaris sp.]